MFCAISGDPFRPGAQYHERWISQRVEDLPWGSQVGRKGRMKAISINPEYLCDCQPIMTLQQRCLPCTCTTPKSIIRRCSVCQNLHFSDLESIWSIASQRPITNYGNSWSKIWWFVTIHCLLTVRVASAHRSKLNSASCRRTCVRKLSIIILLSAYQLGDKLSWA